MVKSVNLEHTFQLSFLMRVGRRAEIEHCWDSKSLSFGCPANWIDKQLRGGDNSTGDIFECVFAHIPSDDPRIFTQVDSRGNPMGENLLIIQNQIDGSYLLRYIPAILTPILCMYAIKQNDLPINLASFASAMKYSCEECAFLFIRNPCLFFDELKQQVPIAVNNNTNLTSERFYSPFTPSNPIDVNLVNYNKYTSTKFFYDRQDYLEELFWKLPEYSYQSECRIVIPQINFVQSYDPNKKYEHMRNHLEVSVPHLHEYAEIHYL